MSLRCRIAAMTLAAATLTAVSAARAAEPASLVVVHGIPGRDLGLTVDPLLPVDVLVNGSLCLLKNLTFGTIAGPYDVPAGTLNVKISLANVVAPCSNPPVINAHATVAPLQFASVVAQLSAAGAPTAGVFNVNVSTVGADTIRFVTAHAAAAPQLRVTLSGPGGAPTSFDLFVGRGNTTEISARRNVHIDAPPLDPVVVQPSRRSVELLYFVGSAKSGTAAVLSKTIPGVL